ncbi:hypothetical protein Pan216_46900 [Planctomycetes bacterium Pan216]|uniref:Carboxypeptidase regulatory-like domain-containing protein n=2 Tax=Kolteria novifilia TaxID=2527975 RepID=A0A518BA07_9BACT|nr:hypothetical protein Pan216_46900 [Planctomycetes bacterium Pan216]
MPKAIPSALVLFSLTLLTGCGGGEKPDLGTVTGTVTLDGEPLSNAEVFFQPEQGRPSVGQTDADGDYELLYTVRRKGAQLGKQTVRISTATMKEDDEGNTIEIPEKVPPQYNSETTLVVEVVPGSNDFDFDLKSK